MYGSYSGIKPYKVNVFTAPEFQKGHLPTDYGLDFEYFDIQTNDSLTLKGYWIKAEKPRCTLILIHGIGDCKEHFYPFCQKLKDIGCQTLIFDLRAQGQSEGAYCTFGYKEKNDIAIIIDALRQKNEQLPIGIYGNSLGLAIALQVLGENKHLKFGIIESTFDEFPKNDRLRNRRYSKQKLDSFFFCKKKRIKFLFTIPVQHLNCCCKYQFCPHQSKT